MRKSVLELSAIPAISGREKAVRDWLLQELKTAPAARWVRVDRVGNLIVELEGKQAAPRRVLFAAHMDEVGGIVTDITADGYLRFDCVGGIAAEALFGHRVTVNGHVGVIGGKAIHQCKGDDKTKVPGKDTLLIDIGAASREEAETVCKAGDAVYFTDEVDLLGESRYVSKALDDRAGCALLLSLAKTRPQYDVIIAFTVREEIGHGGASAVAFSTEPDIAVAVDVTTAADVMETPEAKQVCRMGGGPVVSFMDRSTMYDKPLFDEIFRLAAEHGIEAQTKHVISGGNDAAALQTAGVGSRVAAVSLPCRYLHTASCVLDDADVENTRRLLEVMMNTLPAWDDAL